LRDPLQRRKGRFYPQGFGQLETLRSRPLIVTLRTGRIEPLKAHFEASAAVPPGSLLIANLLTDPWVVSPAW